MFWTPQLGGSQPPRIAASVRQEPQTTTVVKPSGKDPRPTTEDDYSPVCPELPRRAQTTTEVYGRMHGLGRTPSFTHKRPQSGKSPRPQQSLNCPARTPVPQSKTTTPPSGKSSLEEPQSTTEVYGRMPGLGRVTLIHPLSDEPRKVPRPQSGTDHLKGSRSSWAEA